LFAEVPGIEGRGGQQCTLVIHPLFPRNHYWQESRIQKTVSGAMIDHVRFNVPAVTAIEGTYTVVRPDPKENEVLVFSPYLAAHISLILIVSI
jgi:hypothetical protein